MTKLFLASQNAGKRVEFLECLAGLDLTIELFGKVGEEIVPETGQSFLENARIKARYVAKQTGCPSLGDDSGLCIHALNGAPGIDTAPRVAAMGGYDEAMKVFYRDAQNKGDITARFVCTLVLALPDGREFDFSGNCDGEVYYPGRGDGGFGFCPYFHSYESGMRLAEMSTEERMKVSARGKAIAKLKTFLVENPL